MARTSKKQTNVVTVANRKPSKIYSVGIYARLSVDSSERKNESIETQIEIAKAFVKSQSDMILFDCYSDIGKTGTNFEREGFEHMMHDVRMRKIDCVIVKDLSRFGRNHIETGNYIEKIFPFMGVRFIAVTDNFDSMNLFGQNEIMSINLKNLVNEMYARDIALKVKSSRKAKWAQGNYTGGLPPYGYRAEWIGGKKCLFPEETTSEIVKKIYDLFLSGKNIKEIVVWLYKEGIVRPSEYHKTGRAYCKEGERLLQWSESSVRMFLINPVYIGYLVQGRTCGKDYRIRSRYHIDSENWSVKEHTHEPLVSEDIFYQAAVKLEKTSKYCNKDEYSKKIPPDKDIFADILFCGDCGTKMRRISVIKPFTSGQKMRTYNYNCPKTSRVDEEKCVTKNITLQTLTDAVKEAIRQEVVLSAMRSEQLVEGNNMEAERKKKEWRRNLLEQERRIKNTKKLGSEQYLKYHVGELREDTFKYLKEENDKKILIYQKKCEDITEKLRSIDYETVQKNHYLRILVKGDEKMELTAEVVHSLISRIEVYPDHRIKVIFHFKRSELPLRKESI